MTCPNIATLYIRGTWLGRAHKENALSLYAAAAWNAYSCYIPHAGLELIINKNFFLILLIVQWLIVKYLVQYDGQNRGYGAST